MSLILIVEDDPALANLYDQIFKRDGFSVLIARDGAEGLEMAITKKPDCVLLDVMLPKMNGLDVFEKMTDSPVAKQIPVIFLTNNIGGADKEKAMKLGAKDYISKAMEDPENIVKRVKNVLKASKP